MYLSQEFFKSASLKNETTELHDLITFKFNVSQIAQFIFFCTTCETLTS
jgi:hypothetical protein